MLRVPLGRCWRGGAVVDGTLVVPLVVTFISLCRLHSLSASILDRLYHSLSFHLSFIVRSMLSGKRIITYGVLRVAHCLRWKKTRQGF